MEIGQAIKKYRLLKGLTQSELSHLSGVVIGTLKQYERGRNKPKVASLQKIATALGITVNDLLPNTISLPIAEENNQFITNNPLFLDCLHKQIEKLKLLDESSRCAIYEFINFHMEHEFSSANLSNLNDLYKSIGNLLKVNK